MTNIDIVASNSQQNFKSINVRFLKGNDRKSQWEWEVKWTDGTKTPFKVELTQPSQGGTDIQVYGTQEEVDFDSSQKIIIDLGDISKPR